MAVANNPNTPPETLAELAKDEDVCIAAVKNPNTPPETLAELAKDEELYVRTKTTENPNYIALVEEAEIALLSNLLDANRVESENKHNISSINDDYIR